MSNPWLAIPLADYEGHMALPDVGQAEMLAREFGVLLHRHAPQTVAVVGCSGGNGFEQAIDANVMRLVGIDINEEYVEDARRRYAHRMPGLELYCADIQGDIPDVQAVDLVYAALVFEYVDVPAALKNMGTLCRPDGLLAAVLQLPKQGTEAVTPSPFTSLQDLRSIMRLVHPEALRTSAEATGFTCLSQETITLASGKQFSLQLFRLTALPERDR